MKYLQIKIVLFSLLVGFLVVACKPEETFSEDKVKIEFQKRNGDFDKFLQKTFTEPYNIEVLYKWKDIESDQNNTITPANYANSVKITNLVKYLCLDAYQAVAPNNFLKRYFPKMIMLVGSFAYQSNGGVLLGTAEGGLKITLYGINSLNTRNIEELYEYYFRTIFHEFSHILHQTTDYTTDFEKITEKDYLGDAWTETGNTEQVALQKGFISPYSRKDKNEDFVELIAHYITNTDTQWENKLTTAGSTGAPLIKQKLEIIKNYLNVSWKIDLDALRNEVQTRANNINNINLDDISY